MEKKLTDKEIEEMIDNILYLEYRKMSVREITKKLEENYGVKLTPYKVFKYLKSLKEKKKIE